MSDVDVLRLFDSVKEQLRRLEARQLKLERLIHRALHAAAELTDDAENGIVRCDCSEEARVQK